MAPRRVLISGASGSGKTTLREMLQRHLEECAASSAVVTYDLDDFGYHTIGEHGNVVYVIPRHTVQALLDNDPRDVLCFGLASNLLEEVRVVDMRTGETRTRRPFGQIKWTQKIMLVWDADAKNELERRFAHRLNPYGRKAAEHVEVINFARYLYDDTPDGWIRLDCTGGSAQQTLQRIAALVVKGGSQ